MRIKYTMKAPVSHIGETASVGSYFQTVVTANGKLPVITGNAMRGTLRDAGAKHLLDAIHEQVSKEVFNVLFSGGNISGTMKNDLERAKQVRYHFPFVSLLGGGLGTMIMPGKLLTGFLYPLCDETAEMLGEDANGVSWHSLIDEIGFTRTDDSKNDKNSVYAAFEESDGKKKDEASTQMRLAVQYMAVGTVFAQDVFFIDGATDLEKGAFYTALLRWFETPKLGGMSAKGFGTFDADVDDGAIVLKNGEISVRDDVQALVDAYNEFIKTDNTAEWIKLLEAK